MCAHCPLLQILTSALDVEVTVVECVSLYMFPGSKHPSTKTSVAFGQVVLHFLMWFGIAVATIQIKYRVSGFAKRDGLYLCAISATSDSYIGARRKSDGSGMCEPLHFSWFETSVYEDSYEYIMKVCVKRDFPLQVQIFIYLLFINCFRNKTW